MSRQTEDSEVPERRVYVGKAIMAVKNPPIHTNMDHEVKRYNLPKHTQRFTEEDILEMEEEIAIRKAHETAAKKSFYEKRMRGDSIMTVIRKISRGAKTGTKTAQSMEVDKEIQKTGGKVNVTKPSENNNVKLDDDKIFKKPGLLKKTVQDVEAKKPLEDKKFEDAGKNSNEDVQREFTKTTDTFESPLAFLNHMQRSLNSGAERSLNNTQHSKQIIKHKVKIVTRDDRGRKASIFGTVLNIDSDRDMLLTDVVKIWKRKLTVNKAEIALAVGFKRTVRGSGVLEKHLGRGIWLCKRRLPKLLIYAKDVIRIHVLNNPLANTNK